MSLLLLFQSNGAATYQDVWELLHAWYDGHSAIHLAGGFYADQAPGGADLPYAIETCVSESYDHAVGAHEAADFTIQISIFHTNRNSLETVKQAWITSLRDFFATLRAASLGDGSGGDNWELLISRRRLDPDLGPDGQRVWIQDLEYFCNTSKDL